jgi:DNA-binding FrmR family transcriptional regulator
MRCWFVQTPTPGGWGSPFSKTVMSHPSQEEIVRRLKSVEGHVRGVQRMVEEGAYCIDVVNQIVAVQRALKKVSGMVLDDHLHSCVTDALRGPDAPAREKVLQELMQVFEASGKV